MSTRRAAWLAWSLWAVFVAFVILGAALAATGNGHWSNVLLAGAIAGFATVGALIAARRPRNPIGWILSVFALTGNASVVAEGYVERAADPAALAAWAGNWSGNVGLILVCVFLPLLFPDGRLPSRRWRPVAWLGAAGLALSVVTTAVKPGPFDVASARPIENPFGVQGAAGALDVAAALGGAMLVVAGLGAAASLLLRMRRARGETRLQIKWLAYAVGLMVTGFFLTAAVGDVFEGGLAAAIGGVGFYTFLFTVLFGIPAATAIAVFKYRLYDIDAVINRTLVYGALTATLGGAYLSSVLLLQLALSPLGESGLAVAGSTLAVAALFRPARGRIQLLVDRRFYRRKYDASQTLERFGARLRDEIDLDALGSELRAVVNETMQPAHVSLWLREARR